jgi:hypothetical protein
MQLKYINNQEVNEAKDEWFMSINYTDYELSHFYPEMRPRKWT